MLAVEINRANYEYDIHSIVKAFYPEKTVKILTPETKEDKRAQMEADVHLWVNLTDEGAEVVADARLAGESMDAAEAGDAQEAGVKDAQDTETEGVEAMGAVKAEDTQPAAFSWQYDAQNETQESYKDGFKRFLYRSLSRLTGKELPWGNLTGIRPTKIAYGMLEEGRSEEEIMDYLEKSHFVSKEKGQLSIGIAKREREILSDIHYEGGYSLYIGIPFCPTTCLYCSFTSFAIGAYRRQVDAYVDCLIQEMDYTAHRFAGKILDSVYIGGGTPTTLEADQLDRLIGALKEKFDFSTVKEFTVEAGRADSITGEKLKVLYKHGVSRISINPQTMKQETLDIIGRRHTVEQVLEAYGLAREIGFDNINMDLILGLPGETAEDVQNTMDKVAELAPDSLTVHSLAIKRASRLSQWILEHGVSTLKNTDETMKIAAAGAAKLGMEPYYLYRQKNMSGNFENVGYAHPGKFGLYNILIMEEKQTIVALGAGSITKLVLPGGRIERCDNVKDVALYIEKIEEMIRRKEDLFKLEG